MTITPPLKRPDGLAAVECDYCRRQIVTDTEDRASRVAKDAGWLTLIDKSNGTEYHVCSECQKEA